MAQFRIALAQTCLYPTDHDEVCQILAAEAVRAKSGGADVVLFAELVLCGYGNAEKTRRRAMPAALAADRLGAIAAEVGIGIVAGYAERQDQHIYNAALFVDASGAIVANYRKMHLWGAYEQAVFTSGSPGQVFPLSPDLKAGLLICFDLDHPVTVQDLAARGADIVLVLSATSSGYGIVPRSQVPVRAYENSIFLAFCNQAGQQPYEAFLGLSTVAAPDGSVLAVCRENEADLVFADIDPQAFAAYRAEHGYAAQLRRDLFPDPARKKQ